MAKVRASVIEPDAMLLLRIRVTLENAGCRVTCSRKGSDGLGSLLAQPPDLALVSLELPDMDGTGLLQRLHAHQPPIATALIVTTASPDAQTMARVLALGVRGILLKPLSMDALARHILKALPEHRLSFDLKDEFVDESMAEIGRYEESHGQHTFTLDPAKQRAGINACFWMIREFAEVGERSFVVDLSAFESLSEDELSAIEASVHAERSMKEMLRIVVATEEVAAHIRSRASVAGVQVQAKAAASAERPSIIRRLPRSPLLHGGPSGAPDATADLGLPAYLGVLPGPVPDELREVEGYPATGGVLVQDIQKYSPADRYGVRPGDVILQVAGRMIRNEDTLYDIISSLPAKMMVPVKLVREGATLQIGVKLDVRREEEHEEEDQEDSEPPAGE